MADLSMADATQNIRAMGVMTKWSFSSLHCAGLMLPFPLLLHYSYRPCPDPLSDQRREPCSQADHQQYALLRAAGVDPPPLAAFLLDQVLPAIGARLAAQPPLSAEAVAQLEELHTAAVGSLSREMPLPTQQLEQLKQALLVFDDGQATMASDFMVLGQDAEGLRPIVSGPGFPLRPLPAKFSVRSRHLSVPVFATANGVIMASTVIAGSVVRRRLVSISGS